MRLPTAFRAEMARLAPLWEGHAAGAYTLPDAVLDHRQALDRLLGTTVDPHDDDGVHRLIADTASAALSGADWPSVDVLLDAELDRQRAQLQHRVLDAAVESVAQQLLTAVRSNGVAIITAHLRPALDGLLDQLQPHAATVAGLDAEAALRAGGKASKSWLSFDAGAGEYRALREARRALRLLGVAPEQDQADMFGELRNLPEVWPDHRGGPGRTPIPPWPDDPRGRLAWLLANGATIWMPTPAEQDAAYTSWVDAELARRGGGPRPAGLAIGG